MLKQAWRCAAWRLGVAALFGLAPLGAALAANPYPTMAPVGEYLMDQGAEIALARSAAPPSVSDGAEVLVLSPKGYTVAAAGNNGFVCVVERGWFSPLDADDFWDPKLRGPDCYNPQAARSVLPFFLTRTKWALEGDSRIAIAERTHAAMAAGRVPPPERGAITYMMSKGGYLGGGPRGPWRPHLMFYMPPSVRTADWGADLPGTGVLGMEAGVNPYTMFFVPMARWSDGTPSESAGAHRGM